MTNTEPNPIELVRERLDGGRKWLRGDYKDGDRACLLAACDEVLSLSNTDPTRTIAEIAREQFPERAFFRSDSLAIPEFNDADDTTWADVSLVLDKASVEWDARVDT